MPHPRFLGSLGYGRLLGIDETTLQVHRELGRSDTSTSYMWLIRGGTVDRPILKYIYRETRSADFLKTALEGYTGIIQTDGYISYDTHFKGNANILHAGCMAHARREFEKLWKSNKNPIAGDILNRIRDLYKIEEEIRKQELFQKKMFSEIVRIRQDRAKPILDALYIHLQDLSTKSDGTLGLGDAIRPFVLGRKNWLFSGSPDGASASAFWYSFLQTAKANGKEPYKFLLHFLKGLPFCKTPQDCEKLFNVSIGWG